MRLRSVSERTKPKIKFFTKENNMSKVQNIHRIHIQANNFEYLFKRDPLEVNTKWFINLSNKDIPTPVVSLLQFGEKFSLLSLNIKSSIFETVKDIENDIRSFPHEVRDEIRSLIFPTLEGAINLPSIMSDLEINLLRRYHETKTFIRDNPDIILTKADKGNITVAVEQDVYVSKVKDILKDTSTYTVVSKNPIKKLERDLISLLKQLEKLYLLFDI